VKSAAGWLRWRFWRGGLVLSFGGGGVVLRGAAGVGYSGEEGVAVFLPEGLGGQVGVGGFQFEGDGWDCEVETCVRAE